MSLEDRNAQIEYIVEHYENPHNYGELTGAVVTRKGGQPGCGDVVTIYLKMDGDRIADISYTGEGCTISQAATSILTDEVKGKSIDEVERLDYHAISDWVGEEVVQTRPRCATLGLDTLKAALQEYRKTQ
jgi:nitrogen fixation protein NifU and related proteins